MYNVYEKETGEVISNLSAFKKDNGSVTRIDYDNNNYVFSFDENNKACELVVYKEKFITPKHTVVDDEIITRYDIVRDFENYMNSRKFKLNSDGVAIPTKDTATVEDLQKTLYRGGRRAIKSFYNYALANNWEYFATFTFADEKTRNDKDLLYKAWQGFVNGIRKNNKDMKALAVYETFEKGGYHIHALLANCDLTLKPARNPKENNSFMYSHASNEQLFNCLDWNSGHNSVAIIRATSNNAQVVNYLSKYVTKATCAPYGCRRFFSTNNLTHRQVITGDNKDNNFANWISKFNLVEVKNNDKIIVYRNY